MAVGFWTLWLTPAVAYTAAGKPPTVTKEHFGGSAFALSKLGFDTKVTIYAGFVAILVNVLVGDRGHARSCGPMNVEDGVDETRPDEYFADRGDPRVHDLPSPARSVAPSAPT